MEKNSLAFKSTKNVWPVTAWLFQAFAGAILLWSATEHLANQQFFLVSVLRYRIISGLPAEYVASLLPVFQLVLGVFLIANLYKRPITFAAFSVFVLFAVVQASAWIRELPISCGCFGPQSSETISAVTIAKVAFLSISMLLVFLVETRFNVKRQV